MPALYVRDIPEWLYSRLQQRAKVQHRSLSAEVVVLLEKSIAAEEVRADQVDLLECLRCHRSAFCPAAIGAPDSIELLHEDRDR